MAPENRHFEDDFPFPKVGYVNPLEGNGWKMTFRIGDGFKMFQIYHGLHLFFVEAGSPIFCGDGSNLDALPGKLTCPLKINGWKMYFLLKILPS